MSGDGASDYGDVRWSLIYLTSGFIAAAILFVLLRFWARYTTAAAFGADDWLIIAGVLVSFGSSGLNTKMLLDGFGDHGAIQTPASTARLLKMLLAWEVVYTTSMALIKASILCFYLRLFPSRRFRVTTYIVGGTVVAWWIACSLISIFQCDPVYKFWTRGVPGSCMSVKTVLTINAVPNVIQDIVILFMPLDQIWGLQASRAQKMRLYITFGIGGLVLIASLYRFTPIMAFELDRGTETLAMALTCSVVESAAGVICACLLTLRPLVKIVTSRMNMTTQTRNVTTHRPGTGNEYIAMGDTHYDNDSLGKPTSSRLESRSRGARSIYAEEEDGSELDSLSNPAQCAPASRPAPALLRTASSARLKNAPPRKVDEEIVVQTEITISIATKDSADPESLQPWEASVAIPGRVV